MSSEIIAKELEFSVGNIFKNKGTVASIAEKSAINCDAKRTSSPGKSGDDAGNSSLVNLYYFAVQHAFKQVDRQQVFKIEAAPPIRHMSLAGWGIGCMPLTTGSRSSATLSR